MTRSPAIRRPVAAWVTGVVALLMLAGLGLAAPASAAAPSLAPVVAALQHSPVYVDPAAGEPHVVPARLLAVIPKGTYFAALPTADIAATVDPAAGSTTADAAALPALLSARLDRGGTVIVLVGGKLYGASTTVPGSLPDALGSAQATLPAAGDATGALVALLRSVAGAGTLTDAPGPSHAGGPVGPALLIALAILLAAGATVLWWWLRRPPRKRHKKRPARPLGDLIEIDHRGNIVKHTPARDRQG